MGLRVVAPGVYRICQISSIGTLVLMPLGIDMMGYGRTDAPHVPPNLEKYSTKQSSDDLAELARQLGETQIVLGGHDWYVLFVKWVKVSPLTHLQGWNC